MFSEDRKVLVVNNPASASWYLADLVVEVRVEGYKRSVVQLNTVLVKANSPEDAYEKAKQVGRRYNHAHENPAGRRVTFRFRGIHYLAEIVDGVLEHGAELMWRELQRVTEPGIRRLIPKKQDMVAFSPLKSRQVPDYSSKEVVEALREAGFEIPIKSKSLPKRRLKGSGK
jgi:hypothetical protein